MDKIIYILVLLIIIYIIYYKYKVSNIEKFIESEIDESATNLLQQLEILKENIPKTNNILKNDLSSPNAFIPYIVNNLNKITQSEKENYNVEYKTKSDKINILNDKIKGFRQQLELEESGDNITIKSILSSQNGQPLTVLPVSNNNHLVLINNKCLTNNSVGHYDLVDCNYMDKKQHFTLNTIYSDSDYNSYLAPSSKKCKNNIDASGKKIQYPFVLVKSYTSGKCLINTDGKVYMGPCKAETDYRWTPSTSLYKCNNKKIK